MEIDSELSESTKPRHRWLKRFGCGLLILALALLIPAASTWAWRRHLHQQRLDEMLAELDRADPGWRLEDIEAARERIPDEENSARVVIAASRLLPERWPPKPFGDRFDHLAPEEQLAAEDFAWLKEELERVRPALEEARKLSELPRGRHHIRYERNTLETRLDDQAEARRIAILLVYDAVRHDQNGDGKSALASCRAALNASRSLGDEPVTISQLIRSTGAILSCRAIERTLAQCEPPPEELRSLQRALEIEDAHPDLSIIMRGGRAGWHALFNAIEDGDVSLNGLAGVQWGWFDYAIVSIGRMDTRADHALMLSLMARAIANAQLPMHDQLKAERQLDQEVREARRLPRRPLLTGLLMPPMTKRGEFSRRYHASIRCTIIALAAERYRRERGAWPDTLEKLCPKYRTAVPLDPFDGQPLRYHRVEDGVVVYSVGSDEVDDEGNLDREHPNEPGADIGIRLWDVAKRRQPPKPEPAQLPQVQMPLP